MIKSPVKRRFDKMWSFIVLRTICIFVIVSRTDVFALNCISCDSQKDVTCRTNTTFTAIKKCSLIKSKGCYHFINETIEHHRRGCVNDLSVPERKSCIDGSEVCKACSKSNCNSKSSFSYCFHCHYTSNSECGLSAESFTSNLCNKYEDECFTFIDKFGVSKGCLSSANDTFRSQCRSNEEKCEICSTKNGNYCNKRLIDRDEACIECDSLRDDQCITDPKEAFMKLCSKIKSNPPKGCYLQKTRDQIKRGCIQDLESDHIMNDCLQQSETCKSCQGRNCNIKKDFQNCFVCNGHTSPDCASNPSTFKSETCKEYYSTCVTGIDLLGYTHRRCSNSSFMDTDTANFPNGFEICTENQCNDQIYPKNRLHCYQCNGGEECNAVDSIYLYKSTIALEAKPCSIFSHADQCYTHFTKEYKMYRGCLSDPNSRLICDQEYANITGTCVKCQDSKCNSMPKFKTPTLSCISCVGDKECAYGQDPKNVVKCRKNVTFGVKESCYTRFSTDTGFTMRGCTLDNNMDPSWCEKYDDCKMCSTSGCNIKNAQHQFCIRCDSEIDDNCDILNDSYEYVESCGGAPYSYKDRGCFMMKKNGFTVRGCINEFSDEERTTCLAENSCIICTENNCNTKNSGVKLLANFTMIGIIIYQTLLKNVK